MTAVTDLTTNVSNLQASLATQLAAITSKLNEALPDDPGVVAANSAIVDVTNQLNASAAALSPPAPTPEPVVEGPST